MRQIVYFIIIIIFQSCSNSDSLEGEWKADALLVDNVKLEEAPRFPSMYFFSNNFVIYFNKQMIYEIVDDSIFLSYDHTPEETIYRLKVEQLDNNHINLHYVRRLVVDSTGTINYIPYQSQWSRIN